MMDLLDYATSPLNPGLKIAIFLICIAVLLLYVDARKEYGGNVRSFLDCLCLFAFFIALASFLRFFGDGLEFGFTSSYSLKWFQSIAYVAGAAFFVLAAKKLANLFPGGRS